MSADNANGSDRSRLLQGLCVLVTRPRHQSDDLVNRLSQAGAHIWREPMVAIQPIDNAINNDINALLASAATLAIFLSPNAAHAGLGQLGDAPCHARTLAMGPGTARAMARAGRPADVTAPSGATSETLLGHDELVDPRGRQIIVFQGEGGRGLVQQTLRDRGATVSPVVCYRRVKPPLSADAFARQWTDCPPRVLIVTSETALNNLLSIARDVVPPVTTTDIAVISERFARVALERGWTGDILVAGSADGDTVVQTLIRHYGD